jgi:hypothetical protein
MGKEWHGKQSDVSGARNGKAQGGPRLCKRISRTHGLGLGVASGRVLRLDVCALAAPFLFFNNQANFIDSIKW